MSIFLFGLPLDGRIFISSISVYSELTRDTFIEEKLLHENALKVFIPIPALPNSKSQSGNLVGLLDLPLNLNKIKGLVLFYY